MHEPQTVNLERLHSVENSRLGSQTGSFAVTDSWLWNCQRQPSLTPSRTGIREDFNNSWKL